MSFDPGVKLDHGDQPMAGRQRFVFGLPCWLWRARGLCDDTSLIPGPVLHPGEMVDLTDDKNSRFRGLGWYPPEPAGMWTRGRTADLDFRAPDAEGRGAALELQCRGYKPPGQDTSEIDVFANGVHVTRFRAPADESAVRVDLPPGRIGSQGRVSLRLEVLTPRAPADYERSDENRVLGLYLKAMRLDVKS